MPRARTVFVRLRIAGRAAFIGVERFERSRRAGELERIHLSCDAPKRFLADHERGVGAEIVEHAAHRGLTHEMRGALEDCVHRVREVSAQGSVDEQMTRRRTHAPQEPGFGAWRCAESCGSVQTSAAATRSAAAAPREGVSRLPVASYSAPAKAGATR